jgi:hypothetical protein
MSETNPILVEILKKGEANNRQLRGRRAATMIEKVAKAALEQQDPEDWLRRILTLKNLNGGTAYVVAELLCRFERAKGLA